MVKSVRAYKCMWIDRCVYVHKYSCVCMKERMDTQNVWEFGVHIMFSILIWVLYNYLCVLNIGAIIVDILNNRF